ncbi:hypothetical protein [Streptomyces sp. NBC_00728]|uniref:hypothetical protein n=1 Tax=Streptomyces sp. NBC_00728 TaxID=2903676 RepID=UPI00386E95C8
MRELDLERYRARYGLTAVVMSNLAVVAVTVFGVWQLDGDKAVTVGVLTAAFTAVSSTTTAYLGIKAVSNTARAMAQPQVPAPAAASGTAPGSTAVPGAVPGSTTVPGAVPGPATPPETASDLRQPQE